MNSSSFRIDGPTRQRRRYDGIELRASSGSARVLFSQKRGGNSGSVSFSVSESTDWRFNTDLNEGNIFGGPDSTVRLRLAVSARVCMIVLWSCVVSQDWSFDLELSTYRRKDGYVGSLYNLPSPETISEDGEDEKSRLYVLETPLLEETRGSWSYGDRSTKINGPIVMLFQDRVFERKCIHKHVSLLTVHCQEAAVMSLSVVTYMHVLCPSRWASVEELYGVRTKFPP